MYLSQINTIKYLCGLSNIDALHLQLINRGIIFLTKNYMALTKYQIIFKMFYEYSITVFLINLRGRWGCYLYFTKERTEERKGSLICLGMHN